MSILDRARADWNSITKNQNDFGVEMILTAPTGEIAIVTGLHSKHHLGIDFEGNPVNSQNAHISISEQELISEYYPVRNADGNVDLKRHRVSVKDSTGVTKEYVITQWFPNETIGAIVCILGNYKSSGINGS